MSASGSSSISRATINGRAPSSASTTFPPRNQRLPRRFMRDRVGGIAIATPRLPIQPRTHPIELQVDGFLHERVMVEARPMHELDWQVVAACLFDALLYIGKIHGGVVVTGQNHERSADGFVGAPAVPIVTGKLGYLIPAGPHRRLMSDLRGRGVGVIPAPFRRHILVALEHDR